MVRRSTVSIPFRIKSLIWRICNWRKVPITH